jgi:hypothetical protein
MAFGLLLTSTTAVDLGAEVAGPEAGLRFAGTGSMVSNVTGFIGV